MDESIFRKKSMDRIQSPERIDDYIKVMNPSMWLFLGAIILLLLAAVIWGYTARIESVLTVEGVARDNQVTVVLGEDSMDGIAVGSTVRVGDKEGTVTDIVSGKSGYAVTASVENIENGDTEVTFVTERIAPITFLTE